MQTLSTASSQDLTSSGRQHQIWDNKQMLLSHDSSSRHRVRFLQIIFVHNDMKLIFDLLYVSLNDGPYTLFKKWQLFLHLYVDCANHGWCKLVAFG